MVDTLTFTLLGTGTSTGVPSVGCQCQTCISNNPKDKRLRTSLLIQSATTTIVIDSSSDFRAQMLAHNVLHIDAIVYTHHHFDHIGGFDDIRPYNFHQGKPMNIYAMPETIGVLQSTFPYAFEKPLQVGGGLPEVIITEIDTRDITIGDITLTPVPLKHGLLDVMGYRIADFAYCTDTNNIPDSSIDKLRGLHTLILDALRFEPHSTHFTVDQSIRVAKRINARQTYFTHIAHQILHSQVEQTLPNAINLGYDGLSIVLPTK